MPDFIFTIGNVARLAGVTAKTIRHYHAIGLLEEPQRDVNNYRLYSVEHLEKLEEIRRLKAFGLSLQHIKLIFASPNPDDLLRVVLQKHQQSIQHEIARLENQLEDIQTYLITDTTLQAPPTQDRASQVSTVTILSDVIKTKSNGLSDVLIAVEGDALTRIDDYQWTEGYDAFWHDIGHHITNHLIQHESLFIFWMERYLTLGNMAQDDLQGRAWLEEIKQSQARLLLAHLFRLPTSHLLAEKDQTQIHKLLSGLLFQEASPLQREFLKLLTFRPSISKKRT